VAPQPGPGTAPRFTRSFLRAAGLGTFVAVCCGAVASTGDTQRFAVAAIAAGVGWAALCAIGRWLRTANLRGVRRAAGALMIVAAVSDYLRWPPGRR
jgi:hypothetical protein